MKISRISARQQFRYLLHLHTTQQHYLHYSNYRVNDVEITHYEVLE